ARGDGIADRPLLLRAVDAVERVAIALENVKRSRTERVAEARLHAVAIGLELRLTGNHLCRRCPGRPGLLIGDPPLSAPGEALSADADAVADSRAVIENQVEEAVRRIDHQRAGPLRRRIVDKL